MLDGRLTLAFARFQELELDLCLRCNRFDAPRVQQFFGTVSRLGDGPFWLAMVPLLLLFANADPWTALAHVTVVALVSTLTYKTIKHWTARPRPFVANARTRGIPMASSFHTNFHLYGRFYGYGRLLRVAVAYLRWFHNRTRCTLAPCADALAHLDDDGFERVAVLGRGVDTYVFAPGRRDEKLRQSWGAGPDELVFAYIGRVADEKNLELFERTIDQVKITRPTARFVVVGDGPALPAMRSRRPELITPGMLVAEPLGAHYASADVFLFPSRTETFGNVVLEAMASGLAVVAFDYAAAAAHIEHGVSGLRQPLDDDASFVAAACALAQDPDTARRMGKAARRVAEGCSWGGVIDGFAAQLQAVATGSPIAEASAVARSTS